MPDDPSAPAPPPPAPPQWQPVSTSPPPPAPKRRGLAVALVVLAAVVLGGGVAIVVARQGDSHREKSAARPPATTTPPGASAPAGTPSADAGASPGEPAYISEIKRQVSEARGIPWKAPLAVQIVPKDELAHRLRDVDNRDAKPDRDAGDDATLKILKLIPADLDYQKAVDDLLSEQVLGFYDGITKELVVGDDGNGGEPAPDVKISIAHELDHALTDQQFDFQAKSDALDKADQQEQAAALTALIEGDAVTLQLKWAQTYLSEEDQTAALLGGAAGDTTVLERTPAFLRDLLLFPYTSGVSFVDALMQAGNGLSKGSGFSKVDDAYARPPGSTEEILHPEIYTSGRGDWAPPDLADVAAAAGCEPLRRNVLGELTMVEMLKAHASANDASRAAKGWNGDAFQTVRCGSTVGMVDRWKADSSDDAIRLEKALDAWAKAWAGSGPGGPGGRFSGSGGAARVVRSDDRIDLVVAGDGPTAERIGTAAGLPA